MGNIKTLYVRNVVEDLLKKKKTVGTFIVICAVLFGLLGLRQGGKNAELTEGQKQQIEEYNMKVAEYDAAIADTQKCIEESDKQIEELQEYMDESIYMQIDPNNIQVTSCQYAIESNDNIGNICNTFIAYINDGGIKEKLDEEDEELKAKYWQDIIGGYQSGNTFIIYVFHYDTDLAKRIMNIMKKRIVEYAEKVQEIQGEFTFEEMGTWSYVKADTKMINVQNNNLNNLRDYTSGRADQTNKLVNLQNNKTSYIEKNKPDTMEAISVNTHLCVAKYAFFGFIFGTLVACMCVVLKYIMGDIIRNTDDLRGTNLNLLGTYYAVGKYVPELERGVMDIEILAKDNRKVFLNMLSDDELSRKIAGDYERALKAINIEAASSSNVKNSAAELKRMMESGLCVLIVQVGKTTYHQLEQMTQLCERFHVSVLGCIMIE